MANEIDIRFQGGGSGNLDRKAVDLAFRNAIRDILAYAEDRAKVYAPRRTGNLQRDISAARPIKMGNTYIGVVSVGQTAPYARWVESGTGVHGPIHMPIVPKRGNVLKFTWRGRLMYRTSVKGQHGRHFMELAYQDTSRTYVPARLAKLKVEIGAAMKFT